jgi:hypothetical protein
VAGKPYQSCLIPYEEEIVAWRRLKPPMPYSQIVKELYKKYQITVSREAVYRFLKDRAKKDSKTCKYAWDIELSNANKKQAAETKVIEKPTDSEPPVTDKPKQAKETKATKEKELVLPKFSDFGWDDLTKPYKERMSPEDKAILLKLVEEKERNRK